MFAGSVLARQLERAPSQYAGHRVTRGQVGEFVVIESNGSATIGRITEIQLPDRDRLSVGPERNEGDEAANPIGIIRLLGSVDLNSSRSSRGIGEAPRVGDYVYLSHPDFVRYAIVSTEGARKDRPCRPRSSEWRPGYAHSASPPVPIADSALKSAKLLKNGSLKTYPGFSHGMLTVNADVLNADLLAFVQS